MGSELPEQMSRDDWGRHSPPQNLGPLCSMVSVVMTVRHLWGNLRAMTIVPGNSACITCVGVGLCAHMCRNGTER